LKHAHYVAEHINPVAIPNHGTYNISVSGSPSGLADTLKPVQGRT